MLVVYCNASCRNSRVVQFSHLLFKNSRPRHGTLLQSGYVSRCHIRVVLEPVRTILAQACSVLLQPDNRVEQSGVGKSYPSAGYAAQVTHVQFESASSFLRMAIKYFSGLDKPCFAPAWLQSHTTVPSQLGVIIPSLVQSLRNPALLPNTTWCCVDSPDLVEHLVIKHAQHHSRVAPVYLALKRIYLPKLCASPLTRLRAFREQAGQ